jgi:hypothetical protein
MLVDRQKMDRKWIVEKLEDVWTLNKNEGMLRDPERTRWEFPREFELGLF